MMHNSHFSEFGLLSEQGLSSIVLVWTARRIFGEEDNTCCVECAFGGERRAQPGIELYNAMNEVLLDLKNHAEKRPLLLAPKERTLSLHESFLLSACEAAQAGNRDRASCFLSAFIGRAACSDEVENLRLLGWCFLLRGQLIKAPTIPRKHHPESL